MCCGNSILQKGLPFFYLHKIFYTLESKSDMYLDIIDNIINKSEDYLRKEINSEKELLNYVHKIK